MTKRLTTTILALLAAGAVLAAPTGAQVAQPAPPPQLVDRVVAVVGDSVILQSDVAEQLERLRLSGTPLPRDSARLAALQRQALDRLVNELVILQAAERDSMFVTAADIEPQVEARIAQIERQLGGRQGLVEGLRQEGLTLETYRQQLADDLRKQTLQQQFLGRAQQTRRPPPVSDREIRQFFQERQQELGSRPATIQFRQIVVQPAASDSARAGALEEARRVLERVRAGEDFEQLARRFTDEPGGRERAGALGWFRRGRMVPEFERAAYALRPGQVSGIVETAFGFHIIKLEKIKGPERQARHILIIPEITPDDAARVEERAAAIAEQLRDGVPVDSFMDVHDAREQDRVGPVLSDSLPFPYRDELRGAAVGQVVGPFRVPAEEEKFAVVKVTNVQEAGEYSADDPDFRQQIREFLQREKLIAEIIDDLRDRTYIEVRF